MSCYKMIIADDEPMIRKGLLKTIPWEELGFQVTAVCMDGQDVIEYLKDNEADVVFTDVQMCQVSGLEVAKWIREHKMNTKVVMISGYKDFDYVRKAMQLDVRDYILKPLDVSEIKNVFQRIKQELDSTCEEYEKNVNKLLSYREDIRCSKVLIEEKNVVEVLLRGDTVEFIKNFRGWYIAIQDVKKEYIPLLVLGMIDAVYEKLEKSGVVLEGNCEKEKILRRISGFTNEMLPEEMKKILQEVLEEIKHKKSCSKESVMIKAKCYIEDHLSENFGVNELAAYVYLNRSYFSREFKMATGDTVTDYIFKRRMEKAIELIKEGGNSTEKISKNIGYTDVKYFQRVFKKYTGYTIREYRNLVR